MSPQDAPSKQPDAVHVEQGSNYDVLLAEGWVDPHAPAGQLALKGLPGSRTTYLAALSVVNHSLRDEVVCIAQAPGSSEKWSFELKGVVWSGNESSGPIRVAAGERIQANVALDWRDSTQEQAGFVWEIRKCPASTVNQ